MKRSKGTQHYFFAELNYCSKTDALFEYVIFLILTDFISNVDSALK